MRPAARRTPWRITLSDSKRDYDLRVEALWHALNLKDAETAGHCTRVSAYALCIARTLKIPSEQVSIIGCGAFLHDIGKLAIPDAILRKPSVLTTEENGYHATALPPRVRDAGENSFSCGSC